MTYNKHMYAYAITSAGRLADLTQTPTIRAVNGRTGDVITAGNYTWAKLTNLTGCYTLYLSAYASKVDFVATIVPHTDDQATVADVVLLSPTYHDNIDDILEDTATTLPASITAQTTALQGADSDTLETLSDQMDGIATWTAAAVSSSITAGSITQIKGNTWNFDIEDLTLDDNLIQLSIKTSKSKTDAESILMIDTTTGLLYVNGKVGTAGDASLSYAGTTLTVVVDASVTDDLEYSNCLYYGIQSITAGGVVSEVYGGTFVITNDVVRAVE